MEAARQASPSFIISQSLLKLMYIESMMPSNHLILCQAPDRGASFSSCLQFFPASGSFPMSQLLAPGAQIIGVSASASVLPMNIQGWFLLGLAGLILLSKGLSRVITSTTIQKHEFYGAPTLTSIHDYWKSITLTIQTFVGKVMSLLLNMLSKLVIAFLPRSKL